MDLAFSGLYNSAVGAVVDGTTPVQNSTATSTSCGTYGTYMTLEGTIQLTNGQYIYIAHDEEISLWIDDVRIPNFNDRGFTVALEAYIFPGLTGAHRSSLFTSTLVALAS